MYHKQADYTNEIIDFLKKNRNGVTAKQLADTSMFGSLPNIRRTLFKLVKQKQIKMRVLNREVQMSRFNNQTRPRMMKTNHYFIN